MTTPIPDKPDVDTSATEEDDVDEATVEGREPDDAAGADEAAEESRDADELEAPARGAVKAAPKAAVAPVRAPLVELGTGAAWLLGLAAVGQMVAVLFRSNPLAIVVLQAVVIDLALGRAGVRWDPLADEDTGSDYRVAARRIAVGAGAALGVAAVVTGLGVATGWAKVSVHGPTTSLGLGLIRAIAIGVRDGLLYAGLPLYFIGRARAPRMAGVVFGALAAGATLALQPAATPANVALAIAVAAAAAAFWAHEGAGWTAAGVAGGFPFMAGVVLRGGLVDVDWKKGAFAPGLSGDGAPAWMGAAGFAALAAWVVWRARARR